MQAGDILSEKEVEKIDKAERDAARWQALCKGMLADDQHMLQFLDDRMPAEGRSIDHINIAMDLWIEEQS